MSATNKSKRFYVFPSLFAVKRGGIFLLMAKIVGYTGVLGLGGFFVSKFCKDPTIVADKDEKGKFSNAKILLILIRIFE